MKYSVALGALALACTAGAVRADQTILSFSFSDLSGSFNQPSSQFSALGVNISPLQTQGDVSRVNLPGSGTASFGTPGAAAGKIAVNLTVSALVPNTSANGNGTIVLTDADGDTLTATIAGQFFANGPAVFFNGSLSNIFWTDNGAQDGLFNGVTSGSIPLSFAPAPPPYQGAIVQLSIGDSGNFFANSFAGTSTQVNGTVVPTPSSIALLGLGGLIAARRRRI